MDRNKALEIYGRISQAKFAGWQIAAFLDNGKSAAVYRAERRGQTAAIKIFDVDLIDRFGGEALVARSERERLLLNHKHPYLVKMLDAGVDEATGLHFLAMEFLTGKSMAECLDEIPEEAVPEIIGQLASAARFLEDQGLAHRDIKPANIMISPDFKQATLLDLGVLKPVGEDGLTDHGGQVLFIGTNQYASPEFAMRKEDNSREGYRALTFYQLGAVLHDLIMRSPLFHQHLGVPARLANAVQTEVVRIKSQSTPPWLITLAQNCLVKSPETRLRLVNWESFQPRKPKADMALELRERIRQRAAAATTLAEERASYSSPPRSVNESLDRIACNILQEVLRSIGRGDPPLGRRIVYQIEAGTAVRCDFEPSARIGLPYGVSVCLKSESVDPQSRIIRVLGCLADDPVSPEWTPTAWEPIFEGHVEDQSVEDAVGLFVLSGVDRAQVLADGAEK